jgi:hypothetical protein
MSSAAAPAPTRTAPLALWRVAQALLSVIYSLFGGPQDIAARHTFTLKEHALIASWLRCAEAMLRRLLLIEAAAYPKPNTRPLLAPGRKRARRPRAFHADKPDEWRVGFRCFAGDTRARRPVCQEERSSASARVSPAKRFRSARPLAERFEALYRAFNDPAPYARRLARRLHATPHRLTEALRAPPEAVHRVDLFEHAGSQAKAAWRPYFSSA